MKDSVTFKEYLTQVDDIKSTKTKKRMNKKSHKGRHYGGVAGDQSGAPVSERFLPSNRLSKIISWEEEEDELTDDLDDDLEDEGDEDEDDLEGLDDTGDEGEDDLEDEDDLDDEGDDEDDENEDPNRQGVIRVVKGAHLVYKRKTEDGTFEELWIYNVGDEINNELDVRRDILAGTDIEQGKTQTKDGKQQFKLWTKGNAQILQVLGLPN